MKDWQTNGAELVGTAALLCAVIGSGIMAENLSGGNVAVALLANTLATVFALYVLIETIGPISGAHFNPAVSLVMACRKALPGGDLNMTNKRPAVATTSASHWLGPVRTWVDHCRMGSSNMACASQAPKAAPSNWAKT